jgi:pimeloyl-ACP methyl ester carboxylesterase
MAGTQFIRSIDCKPLRIKRVIQSFRLLIPSVAGLLVSCASPIERATDVAMGAGMESSEIVGGGFTHQVFQLVRPGDSRLYVFIEGDGSPWVNAGTRVASDPTPRNPLALRLAALTPGSVLYLGRPCYFGYANQASCSIELWTSARYSETVIVSMVETLEGFAMQHNLNEIVLVGYSGGGTLAVLMAPRLSVPPRVITIAANLDVEAWTRAHGYLPLDGSLNPADEPQLPARIAEVHLVGARDLNVPRSTVSRYLDRVPPASVWEFSDFDHACCWEREWPDIWQRVQREFLHTEP